MPRTLTFAPVDFERETLADGLAAAVFATLGFIAGLAGGAHVVFDYSDIREELARRVASIGEAFRSYFETGELHAKMTALGFREIEDLGPARIRERYFVGRGSDVRDRGGHVLHATTV